MGPAMNVPFYLSNLFTFFDEIPPGRGPEGEGGRFATRDWNLESVSGILCSFG